MIVLTDKEVCSDAGKWVHRLGTESYFRRCGRLPGDTADMFEEADAVPEETADKEKEYEERADALIRERYTLSQELSLLRQRDGKAAEYREYYDYAEACKAKAREEVYGRIPR